MLQSYIHVDTREPVHDEANYEKGFQRHVQIIN